MTKLYSVEGMTCNGCRSKIERKLLEIPGVLEAEVNLEKHVAKIKFDQSVSIHTIRKVLPVKYRVEQKITPKERRKKIINEELEPHEISDLARLKPLFLILGYLTVAAVLINRNDWSTKEFMLDFMGLFFIVFSFFKLLDLKGFPPTFQMYDPLAKVFPPYAWAYPFIETALGLCFLLRFQIPIALIATIIILGITTIGVIQTLLSDKQIKCACLGTALNLPMTKATFIENAIMLVMAVWMVVGM